MSKETAKLLDDLKREMKQELRDFRESLERELRKDIRDIKVSMSFINKTFEEFRETTKVLAKENAELKKSNAELEVECSVLRTQLKENQTRITQCEQYTRGLNVEVKGIPLSANESVPDIIKQVGAVINVPLTDEDIEVCHRVPAVGENRTPNIVVQFVRRSKRNVFLEAARKRRLSCSDLGLDSRAPLFVNEHLCPSLKRLLGAAVAKKKECGWCYLWVRNGKIFARKADKCPVVQICQQDDLSLIS